MYGIKNAARRLKEGKFDMVSWRLANTHEAKMRHKWYRNLHQIP